MLKLIALAIVFNILLFNTKKDVEALENVVDGIKVMVAEYTEVRTSVHKRALLSENYKFTAGNPCYTVVVAVEGKGFTAGYMYVIWAGWNIRNLYKGITWRSVDKKNKITYRYPSFLRTETTKEDSRKNKMIVRVYGQHYCDDQQKMDQVEKENLHRKRNILKWKIDNLRKNNLTKEPLYEKILDVTYY